MQAVRSPASRIEPIEKRISYLKKCTLPSLRGCILRQRQAFFKKTQTIPNTAIPKNRYKHRLKRDSCNAVAKKSSIVAIKIILYKYKELLKTGWSGIN
jgi:hypothetical protein